jgi:hypothetical protein
MTSVCLRPVFEEPWSDRYSGVEKREACNPEYHHLRVINSKSQRIILDPSVVTEDERERERERERSCLWCPTQELSLDYSMTPAGRKTTEMELSLSPRQPTAAANTNENSAPSPPLMRDLSCVTRFFVILCYFLGFMMSFVSFVFGALAAMIGLNSLIQRILYQGEWMDRLIGYMESAVRVSGTIVNKSITVDPLTDYISYSVTVEYDGSIVSQSADNERLLLVRKTFDTKSYPSCQDLYEYSVGTQQDSATIEIMLTPGEPQSGTPTRMMERKFRDFVFCHHIVYPPAAIISLLVYFIAAWEYVSIFVSDQLQVVLLIMSLALLALVLMAPLLFFVRKDHHEKRVVSLALDPSSLETEFDSWRRFYQFLGPTLLRKLYAVLFVIGIFSMFVAAAHGALFGYMLAWSWIRRSTVMDQKMKLLQAFQWNADLVSGFIRSRRKSSSQDTTAYYVTFRYDAPCGAVIEKEVQSVALYHQKKNAAVEVRVLEQYPRSGIAVLTLRDELHGSFCASWVGLPLAMAVGSAGYFGISWLIYMYEEEATRMGVLEWLLLLFTALNAILPQGHVLSRVAYERFVSQRLKESGTVVVPCPETCRHEAAAPWGKEDDTTEPTTTCETVKLQQIELV